MGGTREENSERGGGSKGRGELRGEGEGGDEERGDEGKRESVVCGKGSDESKRLEDSEGAHGRVLGGWGLITAEGRGWQNGLYFFGFRRKRLFIASRKSFLEMVFKPKLLEAMYSSQYPFFPT